MHSNMVIGIIGGGAFGRAIASLFAYNGLAPHIVDVGERLDSVHTIVILAVPVQNMRQALRDNVAAFGEETRIVNCSKGLEKGTCALPHEIFAETVGKGKYSTLSGPSFAKEIVAHVPTVVDIASRKGEDAGVVRSLLETPYFKLEEHEHLVETELAGALKNVYAVAAGFLAGTGGGANTHAHLQVVALREYQALAEALEGKRDVVRPSIIGDLQLTSGSRESRNFRFGLARALGDDMPNETVEGRNTVYPLLALAEKKGVSLPLARAVVAVIDEGPGAKSEVYKALGF